MAKRNPVSLSGIQAAMGKEEPVAQDVVFASELATLNLGKNVSTGRSIIYRLLDTNIRGNYYMTLIDDVKSRGEGGGNERIRVLEGVETIWQKDQKDVDKDYINKNRRYLLFQKGVALVPEYDKQVIEFMNLSNANVDNPNKTIPRRTMFYKWNPEKQAEEQLKKDEQELNAIFMARDADEMKMRKHASFLNISMADTLGEPLTTKGIRAAYIRYAKANPDIFMESINSKEVEITYLVKRGLIDGKIDAGRGNGNIYWAEGGLIGRLPVSQTAQAFLITLAMGTSDESKEFLEHLKEKLNLH